jgi:hypothetical protein
LGRAVGRAAWLATRLPYLAGSRPHRGQWISVAAEYLGRLTGAVRYRLLDRWRAQCGGLPALRCMRGSDKLPAPKGSAR